MRRIFWKSRTFRLWIICYLLVLLLPMVFSSLLHTSNTRVLTQKAYDSGMAAVQQIASVIDGQLSALYNISDAICVAPEIRKLKFLSLPFDAAKYYETHQRARYLNNFAAYRTLVDSFYIYCNRLSCILDAGHIYTRVNQYDRIVQQVLCLENDQFERLMAEPHQRALYLTDGGRKVLYLQTIATGAVGEAPPLTLIMLLNTATVQKLLSGAESANDAIARVCLPDERLLSGDASEANSFVTTVSAFRALFPEGGDYVVSSVASDASAFSYALSIPKESLFSAIRNGDMVFIYSLICTVLLGIVLALLLAQHNYRPVYRLKKRMEVDSSLENDFAAIDNRLAEIQKNRTQMEQELQRLSLIEDRQLFDALVSGDLDALDKRQFSQLQDGFTGNLFVVVCLEADAEKQAAVSRRYIIKQVNHLFTTLSGDVCTCTAQYFGSRPVAVLCFAGSCSPYDAQLYAREVARRMLSVAPELSGMTVYIGDACENIQGVALSYQNALRAKEYTDFVSERDKQIILYDDTMVSSELSWKDYDIVDAERRFISLMVERDYAASEPLLREIMSYYTGHDGLSLHMMQCRMYGVLNMLLNVLRAVEADISAAFPAEEKPLEQLLNVRTMQELEDVVFDIMAQLRQYGDSRSNQLDSKLARVEAYIDAQYFDPNLSVQQVAEKFGMSLPYLSREFKAAKGTGVLTWINQCRIEKAKQIIAADESITLADVAQQIGYNSSQTFIRIFKRYEGVTPGQYRAQLRGGDSSGENSSEAGDPA